MTIGLRDIEIQELHQEEYPYLKSRTLAGGGIPPKAVIVES